MAKTENRSRNGRKLKAAKNADAVQESNENLPVVAAPTTEKRSSSSRRSKRSSSSKRSKKSQPEEMAMMAGEEVQEGNMAEDDKNVIAEAEKQMNTKEIEKQVEAGNFKSEFTNADADGQEAMADKQYQATSVNARGRIHEFCDDMEEFAMLMLTDALKNKGAREQVLSARMQILKALYAYRDSSDCEDDFSIEEFQKEMRLLATVQRKLKGLDSKISALMVGADDDSSDTDGDGEAQNLKNLKNARQNLRYALGDSMPGFC